MLALDNFQNFIINLIIISQENQIAFFWCKTKETIKLKDGIDVKKSTANSIKLLEKKGVQINLLLAGILDGLDYEEINNSIDDNSEDKSDKLVGLNNE